MKENESGIKPINSINFLGMTIHNVMVEELHRFIYQRIEGRRKACVFNLNTWGANLAIRLAWFKKSMQHADLVFCDGEGIRWGLRLLGHQPPPKITYDRWIWQLGEFCELRGYRLFLLGSEDGVAQLAAEKLKSKFKNIKIAGTHHGYFQKEGRENEEVIKMINDSQADILIVGFGMPIQEKWISDHKHRLNSTVFLSAGAALECASGKLSPPPAWMVRTHLEWLYRWGQQPRRRFKRYAWGIPYFFWHILLEKIRPGYHEKKN